MVSTRAIAYAAGFISIIVWRSGRVAKNSIFTKHDFPSGYFADGAFDTACTTLKAPDLKYCEDATFWDLLDGAGKFVDRGVLISCDANRKSWNTVMGPLRDPEPRGSLWIYDDGPLKSTKGAKGNLKRIELKNYPAGHDFHPLGLEIYPSYAGNTSNLYVVNHARERTVIEHFTLSPSAPTVATHIRTLSSPYFIAPNSLALTGPDSFYVTNDHLFTRRLPYIGHVLPILESLLAIPLGFVSHITLSPPTSTSTPAILAHKLSALFIPFPNGIALSPDGTRAALASTTLGHIAIYTRDPATHTLTLLQHVPVPFTPDNLRYTHDGAALIVAGHPNFPALAGLAANASAEARAPSWVLEIAVGGQGEVEETFDVHAPVSARGKVPAVRGYEVRTLFQSDGTGFSSSCTGLKDPVSGALYVTGLYAEEGVMICKPA